MLSPHCHKPCGRGRGRALLATILFMELIYLFSLNSCFPRKTICFIVCFFIILSSLYGFFVPEADAFLPLVPAVIAGAEAVIQSILMIATVGVGLYVANRPINYSGDSYVNPSAYNEMAHLKNEIINSDNQGLKDWVNSLYDSYADGLSPGEVVHVPTSVLSDMRSFVASHIGTNETALNSPEFADLSFSGSLQNWVDYVKQNFPSEAYGLSFKSSRFDLAMSPSPYSYYLDFEPAFISFSINGFTEKTFEPFYHWIDFDFINGYSVGNQPWFNSVFAPNSDLYVFFIDFFAHNSNRFIISRYLPHPDSPKYNLPDVYCYVSSLFPVEYNSSSERTYCTADSLIDFYVCGSTASCIVDSLNLSDSDVIGGLDYNADLDTYDLYAPGTDVANYSVVDGVSVPLFDYLSYDDVISSVGTGTGTGEGIGTGEGTGNYTGVLERISSAVSAIPASIASGVQSLFLPTTLESSIEEMKLGFLDTFDGVSLDFSYFGTNGKEPPNILADMSFVGIEEDRTIVDYSRLVQVVDYFRPYIRGIIIFMLVIFVINQILLLMGHSTITQGVWMILNEQKNGGGDDKK